MDREESALFVDSCGKYLVVPLEELHSFVASGLEGKLAAELDKEQVRRVIAATDRLIIELKALLDG